MNTKEFGPLYALASNGKTKIWQAKVQNHGLFIYHGYTDGVITEDKKMIEGKNIGRANETSPFEQACSEAQSKYNKKLDEGYMADIDDVNETIIKLPMLAQKYTERKHYLKYPCFVQPKLNGCRCIAELGVHGVEYISRQGKKFTTLNHLDAQVKCLLDEIGISSDGEIFHPEWTFQEIIANLKKERPTTKELEYWIYDIVDTDHDFFDRNSRISNWFDDNYDSENSMDFRKFGNLVEVPTFLVDNEKEFLSYHKHFTQDWNFEGTILRNSAGKYMLKHRSNDLLKFKDFQDSEFLIIGAHEGTGNDIGTVIFDCETDEGLTFSVRPKGSRELRREWLKDIKHIVNKKLTVKYQNLSDPPDGYKRGVPVFPVGIGIRDYE